MERVNEVENGKRWGVVSVRNSKGEYLTRENEVEVRWREYYEHFLTGDVISEVGDNDEMMRGVMIEDMRG